jgi:hypothetical protein
MSIVLGGDGTITGLTATGISAAQTVTITSANLPAGTVLQVVNSSYNTFASTNSSTFSSTGLTATITPKFATSKILVMGSLNGVGKTSQDTYGNLRLIRGASTVVTNIDFSYAKTGNTVQSEGGSSVNFLDSPATTSATTYTIQFASGGNVNLFMFNNYQVTNGDTVSTLTLMEIAQ